VCLLSFAHTDVCIADYKQRVVRRVVTLTQDKALWVWVLDYFSVYISCYPSALFKMRHNDPRILPCNRRRREGIGQRSVRATLCCTSPLLHIYQYKYTVLSFYYFVYIMFDLYFKLFLGISFYYIHSCYK